MALATFVSFSRDTPWKWILNVCLMDGVFQFFHSADDLLFVNRHRRLQDIRSSSNREA
jgi:hypothetical protein